ncbi:MAG: Mur ligase family protein [Chitinophagales bacterium]
MPSLTLERIAAVIGGRIILGNPSQYIPLHIGGWRGAHPGRITFLANPKANAKRLLSTLNKYHVACILVRDRKLLDLSRWRKNNIAVIEVGNLGNSYLALARAYRRQLGIPFIQVMGSAGKTTTKEMIGAVLREKLQPMVSYMNDNLPDGVANSIFRVNGGHRSAVIEAGMLGRGIIGLSTRLINPNIVVVTSIQRAHAVRLGSIKNIIAAKSEVLSYMGKDSTLILNGEDENIKAMPVQKFGGLVLRYGFSPRCNLWASDIKLDGLGTIFTVNGIGIKFRCRINTFGKYNVGNALAAVLVGLQVGMSPNEIASGLSKFYPVNGRLRVHQGKNNSLIINDNFNANPDSTRLLIRALGSLAVQHHVALVLGDMERPSNRIALYARQVHYEAGKVIAETEIKEVLAIGKWGKEYVRGAVAAGYPRERIAYYPTVAAARPHFKKLLAPGMIIVLKASVYTPVRGLMKR